MRITIEPFTGFSGGGWKPKYENGVEIPNWKNGLDIADYLNKKGNEGWELISYTPIILGDYAGLSRKYDLVIMKRPLT